MGSDVLVALAQICCDHVNTVVLGFHQTALAVMLAIHSSVYRYPSREMGALGIVAAGVAMGMMHERYEVTDRRIGYH